MKKKIKGVTSKIYFLLFVVLTLLVFNGTLIILIALQNEETQVPTLNSYEENIKKYLDGKEVKNVEDTTETLSPTKKTEAYNNDGLAYSFTEISSKDTISSVTKGTLDAASKRFILCISKKLVQTCEGTIASPTPLPNALL